MSVADYTSKFNEIYDSLVSININIEEDEMVQVCLGGLASKCKMFQMVVCTKENTPSFFELQWRKIKRRRVHTPTTKYCTQRKIGFLVVADEADRHVMEAAKKSRINNIIEISGVIPNPPEAGGVMATPKASKTRPQRNVGIVARKATGRASVGKRKLIWTKGRREVSGIALRGRL